MQQNKGKGIKYFNVSIDFSNTKNQKTLQIAHQSGEKTFRAISNRYRSINQQKMTMQEMSGSKVHKLSPFQLYKRSQKSTLSYYRDIQNLDNDPAHKILGLSPDFSPNKDINVSYLDRKKNKQSRDQLFLQKKKQERRLRSITAKKHLRKSYDAACYKMRENVLTIRVSQEIPDLQTIFSIKTAKPSPRNCNGTFTSHDKKQRRIHLPIGSPMTSYRQKKQILIDIDQKVIRPWSSNRNHTNIEISKEI